MDDDGGGGRLVRPWWPVVSAGTWLSTIHLVSNLPIAAVTFPFVLAGIVVAFATVPVFLVGIPILGVVAIAARGLGRFHRARYALALDVTIPDPPEAVPAEPGFGPWVRAKVGDPYAWRHVAYELLLLPWGALTFAATLVIWTGPAAALSLPLYNWALPNGGANLGFGITIRNVPALIAVVAIGLALLLNTPFLIRGLAAVDARIATALLGAGKDAVLAARVGQLERSRAAVVDAAETERRRIERDLHDGAQQRLVALAMNLGRARARYAEDPDAARSMIDEAHTEAKQALAELRNLARGIHPAVLTDRGLDAALSGLAGRSPVPVDVEVDAALEGSGRPSKTIEAIAYFVVAEALTNVAKHARATRASVVVRRLDTRLRIVITDDGVGGADSDAGSGLAGLADRVSGVDGTLLVDSPLGGPTVLTVELPCAS